MHWAEIGECSNNPSYMHAMCDAICAVTGSERCVDDNIMCHDWAQLGECDNNPQYMLESCRPSCGVCGAPPEGCVDGNDDFCPQWADAGECEANPSYMLQSCKLSCDACDDDAGSTDQDADQDATESTDGDRTGGTLDHHEGTDAADYDSCEDITIAYKAMVIGAKEAARICDQKLCKTKGTQDNFKQCKRKKKKKCKGLSVSECEKGCKVRRKKNKKDKCIRS